MDGEDRNQVWNTSVREPDREWVIGHAARRRVGDGGCRWIDYVVVQAWRQSAYFDG